MAISDDLFLAILSMDSYNRGYGTGLEGLGGVGSQIGNAKIIDQSETMLVKRTQKNKPYNLSNTSKYRSFTCFQTPTRVG